MPEWIASFRRDQSVQIHRDDLRIPAEEWRKHARAAARKAGMKIRTRWAGDWLVAWWEDRPPISEVEMGAIRDALNDHYAAIRDRLQNRPDRVDRPIRNFQERVDENRRKMVRAVPDQDDDNA